MAGGIVGFKTTGEAFGEPEWIIDQAGLNAHVEGDLVGGFSLNREGEFVIRGLAPGIYAVRAEPIDDADTDSFFDDPGIDTNFRATLSDHLVAVPAGGSPASFDITVAPK